MLKYALLTTVQLLKRIQIHSQIWYKYFTELHKLYEIHDLR